MAAVRARSSNIVWLLLLAGCDDGGHNAAHICVDAAAAPPAACRAEGDAGPREAGRPLTVPAAPPVRDEPVVSLPGGSPGPRPAETTCRLPEAPPPGELRLVDAFPGLRFRKPLWFGDDGTGDGRLYVAEKCHGVRVFRANTAESAPFLELTPACDSEQGVLGLAFHPRYAENGRLFVYYSLLDPRRSVISEFRRDPQDPDRVQPGSERVLLEVPQPYGNHNGGDLRFGPDGHLYVALGDGGAGGDPHGHGQRPSTLLGSILRLDVDRVGPRGLPYAIPPDNPFADCATVCGDGETARPEVWAYGLRNPWRMSFDRATGELWTGDVGQGRFEEIDRIVRGGNYGWNLREGFECYEAASCRAEGLEAPVFAYGRGEGQSVTGGFVYRGPDLPELWGRYVYGDFRSGRIWALARDGADNRLLAASGLNVASFGEDRDGRLYVASYGDGRIYRLARRENAGGVEIPRRLSETGCFTDTAAHRVAPGVVPYAVNVELWSDGADKLRYFALPPGARIGFTADGAWDFPVGSLLLKTFTLAGPDGAVRRLETRILARQASGWQGYTWRWNEAQTDAELLDGALTERVETADGPLDWTYPSRADCDACHTPAMGHALGPRTRQLDRQVDYGDGPTDQLAALAAAGWLDVATLPADRPAHPRLTDASAPVEARARAYLEANCAHCHAPGAGINVDLDLRAATPLAATGLCAAPADPLGLADARRLAPGAPARSVLLQRMLHRGDALQMPPLATARVDAAAARVVADWIDGLPRCAP